MRTKVGAMMLVGAMVLALASTDVVWADETGNEVFFRGGWASLTSNRQNELFTDLGGTGGTLNNSKSGYYVGGGLDLMLSRDFWGMMNKVAVLGEIGVEYNRFKSQVVTNSSALLPVPGPPSKEQLTMLVVDIAPKIKFMQGSAFQPWIIPAGMDFIVISPPSNQTTVLDIGVQFAVGAEYRIWKEFKLGVDGRFHLASGQTNTTNNFGTVGGYIGIGF